MSTLSTNGNRDKSQSLQTILLSSPPPVAAAVHLYKMHYRTYFFLDSCQSLDSQDLKIRLNQQLEKKNIHTPYLTPPTLIAILYVFFMNTVLSDQTSISAILIFANFAVLVLPLISKQPVALPPPLLTVNLTNATQCTTVFQYLK